MQYNRNELTFKEGIMLFPLIRSLKLHPWSQRGMVVEDIRVLQHVARHEFC